MGGTRNVEGRLTKCGHGVTMYTYPAWTFGGSYKQNDGTEGPGPGGFVNGSAFGTTGPAFGRAPGVGRQPAHGPLVQGDANLRPGTLTGDRRPPAYTFGKRHALRNDGTPGPQDYYAQPVFAANPQPSWGPPPSRRAMSAPRPMRAPEDNSMRRTKGPTFGNAWPKERDSGVPGPSQYQPHCNGCCQACEGYKGKSFGMRPPIMYGRVTTITPGPAGYHTECSTIGAATQNCESGASTFRRSRVRS